MAKSFDELVKRTTTKATRNQASVRTKELIATMLLGDVREMNGQTQRQLAAAIGIKQPSLAKLEKQEDIQVSTLRKIIHALGGEVEIFAKFPKGTVQIVQFGKPPRISKRRTAKPQVV